MQILAVEQAESETNPVDKVGTSIEVGDAVAFAGLAGPSAVIRTGTVDWITARGNVGILMKGGTLIKRRPQAVAVLKKAPPSDCDSQAAARTPEVSP